MPQPGASIPGAGFPGVLIPQGTTQLIEQLQEVFGFTTVQFGAVVFEWAGASTEAGEQEIPIEKVNVGAQAFTTIYANTLGRGAIVFITSLTAKKLKLGCITSTGGAPPGGSKQTAAWMVISP